MKTIDLTPTWSEILLVLLHVYANANSHEATKNAYLELQRMATLADRYVSEHKAEGGSK